MDPIQARALDALEPFVALAKSATSPVAASDLVTRATSASNTYVFAELLETPNVQALRHAGDKFAPYLTLLEIFAWGTWQDYHATPNLPPLNEQQTQKLRLLSLLYLCTDPVNLSYARLQEALSLPTVRALEDLIISATYAGLISAKLSPATSQVQVSFVAPLRDLAPGAVSRMLDTLADWDARCASVLDELETQIQLVRHRASARRRADTEMRKALDRALLNVSEKGSGKRLAADVADSRFDDYDDVDVDDSVAAEDAMDLDEAADPDWTGSSSSPAAAGTKYPGHRKNARTRFGGLGRRLG